MYNTIIGNNISGTSGLDHLVLTGANGVADHIGPGDKVNVQGAFPTNELFILHASDFSALGAKAADIDVQLGILNFKMHDHFELEGFGPNPTLQLVVHGTGPNHETQVIVNHQTIALIDSIIPPHSSDFFFV